MPSQNRQRPHPTANSARSAICRRPKTSRSALGHKVYQLSLAAKIGFVVPDTLITSDPSTVLDFYEKQEDRVVVKHMGRPVTVQEGGVQYVIPTSGLAPSDLDQLNGLRYAPCLFQERIEKSTDLRITVVGKSLFPVAIHTELLDWRGTYCLQETPHEAFPLPPIISEKCLTLVTSLGLCYGAIDMALTRQGTYVFFEVNPGGQWLWLEQMLKLPISDAIIKELT